VSAIAAVVGLVVLVIHIGTQKTGTTALQRFLFFNYSALLKEGIRFIGAGRDKGRRAQHNEFARAIQGRTDIAIWARLRDELAQSDSQTNLMSAEGFWFCDPVALKQQLPDVKDVRIVVYLRRQDQYLQSLYMQAVRGGRRDSFATWREKVPDRGKYLAAIEKWADAFGSESIIIRPYERNGTVDTIEDFSKLIGAKGLMKRETRHRSPSPRQELLYFMRAFNQLRLHVDEHKLFQALTGKDAAYVRSCHLLTYEESLTLMENYAEDNRILVEKYYRDKSVPLFPELVPFEPPEKWDLESEEFFKLTVDVLDVMINFAADGRISRRKVEAAHKANGKPPAADAGASSDARGSRRIERQNERQKLRASRRAPSRQDDLKPVAASEG